MGIHDQLFKQLLNKFFLEFICLFLPALARYLSDFSIEDGDKELLDMFEFKDSNQVDVIKKAKDSNGNLRFVVHIEAQGQKHGGFVERMFTYYGKVFEKYYVPVYPIALLSFDTPRLKHPSRFTINFPDMRVLDYRFRSIQLNRLNWQKYKDECNPIAVALLPKMRLPQNERHLVKLNCDLVLTRLKLDEEGIRLLSKFIEVYLPLNADETEKYEEEFRKLSRAEQEDIMELYPSWERKALERGLEQGIKQGIGEGKRQLILSLIQSRFGTVRRPLNMRIAQLSDKQLEEFAVELIRANTLAEIERWLDDQTGEV